jgi:hypothetical protein
MLIALIGARDNVAFRRTLADILLVVAALILVEVGDVAFRYRRHCSVCYRSGAVFADTRCHRHRIPSAR